MANGFSLTRDDGLPAFAERFAGIGVTAFAFDFRYLGASNGEPRQLIDPTCSAPTSAQQCPSLANSRASTVMP
jgi:hypothetical protein